MGKFDGYLLVSDLDGTLIDGEAGVSPANLAAIHRFVAQGGRFMVAEAPQGFTTCYRMEMPSAG